MSELTMLDQLAPDVRERFTSECQDRPVTVALMAIGEAILDLHRRGVPRDQIRAKILDEVQAIDTPAFVKESIGPHTIDAMLTELLDPSPVDEVLAELAAEDRRPKSKSKRRDRRP